MTNNDRIGHKPENALSDPVIITQPIESSLSKSPRALEMSFISGSKIAFKADGRSSSIKPTFLLVPITLTFIYS